MLRHLRFSAGRSGSFSHLLKESGAIIVALVLAACGWAIPAAAQPHIEKNVVYGMYSGLALLMDVHHPEKPNGYGIIFVAGSGWTAQLAYGAGALKEDQIPQWGPALLRAGYTVFAINHRATPRFQYPAPVDDVQRAVRFVRHHAPDYGINPGKIGGVGGSSGGHLIGLVAMLAASGIANDTDPVNQEPATLQCVVLRAAPADLRKMIGTSAVGLVVILSAATTTALAALDDPAGIMHSTRYRPE